MTNAIKTLDWVKPDNPKHSGRTEIFMVQRLANADGTEMEYGFVVHDKLRVTSLKGNKTEYITVESFESFPTEKEAEDNVDEYIKLRHAQGYQQKEPSELNV